MVTYTGEWLVSGTTATYTIKDGTDNTVATVTVTGLKSGFAENDLTFTFTDSTDFTKGGSVELTKDVLGTTKVTISAKNASNQSVSGYKLTLDSGVPTSKTAVDIWEATKPSSSATTATATYKNVVPAYYKANDAGTEVTYTAQKTNATYATITGLSLDLLKDDAGFSTLFIVTKYVPAAGETPETVGTIALAEDALAEKNVKLTAGKDYKYKLSSEANAPEAGTPTWSVSSGTVLLKAPIETAGYVLSEDGSQLSYIADTTSLQTIAKITGLNTSGLKVEDDKIGKTNSESELEECLSYEGGKVKILSTRVLNKNASTKVAFSTNLLGADFALDAAVPHEKLDPLDAWVADATTPTTYYYKKFTPAYYDYDAATKTVSYVAPVDSKTTGTSSKSIVYATVSGLKSGLLGDADYVADLTDSGISTPATTGTGTITISDANVLNKKTVEVTNGIDASGTAITNALALSFTDDGAPTLVDGSTPAWSKVSDGKFKLTANFTDGYALKGGKIEYIKAKNNVVVATIEGLDSSTTLDAVAEVFNPEDLKLDNTNEFELISTLLGGKDVVLTMGTDVTANYGIDCNLTLNDSGDIPTTAETVPQWVLEGTTDKTAKFYAGAQSEYYQVWNDKNNNGKADEGETGASVESAKKIKYNAAALGNETVKVTGLNKDLVVDEEEPTKASIKGDDDKVGEDLTIFGTTVTVTANALADKDVKITGGTLSYTPEADDDPPIAATYNYELEHKASDGSATLKRGTNAYYDTSKTTELKYNAAKAPSAVAKIKGLNKDLEYGVEDKDVADDSNPKIVLGYYADEKDTDLTSLVEFTTPADEEAAEAATGAKTITIVSDAVLNGETVKFDGNSGTYKLALGEDVDIAPKSGQNLWYDESTKSPKISKFTYYDNCTSAGYKLDTEKNEELTYSGAKTAVDSTKVVTVVGLDVTVKDGKLVDKDGNVIGQDDDIFTDPVDTSEKTVTLGINALGASDVYFYGDYSKDFTFVLTDGEGEEVEAGEPFVNGTPKTTWTAKSGTVTYQYDIPATYELNAGDPGTSASAATDEDEDEEEETKDYLGDSKYIRYTKPATVKATITGLSESKATVKDDVVADIEVEDATAATAELKTSDGKIIFDATEAVPGEFTIAESLFNGKEIKVSSGNKAFSYTLDATASDDVLINDDIAPVWNTDNIKSGTVTYEKSVDKKKYVVDGSDKIAYYSDKTVISTLATIKGLSKGLKADGFVDPTIVSYDSNGQTTDDTEEIASTKIVMTKNLLAGSSKVTLTNGKDGAKATDYTFGLAEDITGPTDQYPKWVTKSGTATYQYQTTDGYTIGDASKTSKNTLITYSSEKWTPIFVVSGLSKLENDYTIEAKTVGEKTYGPLDKLRDANNEENTVYDIELTVDADDNAVVNVTGDTGLTSSDIKLSNKIKEADWNKAVATKGSWAWLIANGTTEYDAEEDAAGESTSYPALPSVQFTLGVADELNPESRSYTEQWAYNNGTATLTNGTYAGYELGTADKTSGKYFTVKYVKPKIDETIATISGLPKPTDKTAKPYYVVEDGVVYAADSETGEATYTPAFTYDSAKNTITFTADGLANATGTIKVKEKNIKLTVHTDAAAAHVENDGEGAWSIANGKATLNRTVSKAGYKASSDGLSIIYVPDKDKKGNATVETLATITGLNKNLTLKTVVTDVEIGTIEIQGADGKAVDGVLDTKEYMNTYISLPDQSDQTNFKVTLGKDVLGTSAIKITGTDKTAPYSLALGVGVQDAEPVATDHWEISGNKATYLNSVGAYYELVENTKTALNDSIKYHAPGKALQTYFTITGLNKNANLTGAVGGGSGSEDGDLVLNKLDNVITLSQNVFDESSTRTKESTKIALAIDKKIDTKYTLDLADGVDTAGIEDAWSDANNGKSTLNRTITDEGYLVSSDAKNITYGTEGKSTILATLGGVKEAPSGTQSGKSIAIGESQVNGSKVTLKDNIGGGYYLALDTGLAPTVVLANERTEESLKADSYWSAPKSGKVSLMGIVSEAGYAQSDNYNISYTAAAGKTDADIAKAKNKALATITGIKTSFKTAEEMKSTATGSVVTIDAEDLASKAVTVDGGGIISFDLGGIPRVTVTGGAKDDTITAGGTGVSISALAGNDSISVSGSNVSVNAGAGNDYIDIADNAKATIIYAKGNGNDIITGYNPSNVTFSITGATTTTVDFGEDDTVINVDKNTITLKGYAGAVKIGSKTYEKTTEDLLLDDNYSMTAANDLSSIIKADTGSYSPYQFSDALKLTKEESFTPQIAYGINKK